MSNKFSVKILGLAKFVIGIHVHKEPSSALSLDQEAYIKKLLAENNLLESNPVSVPIAGDDVNALATGNAEPYDKRKYRRIVGSLMYAAVATRPDISYAVGFLARHLGNPTQAHATLATKLLKYLNGKQLITLTYPHTNGQVKLEGYCDADWGGSDTRRSTTGYIYTINGTPITWSSKLQDTTALSSTEAEYMALTNATTEAIWLRRILTDLGHPQTAPTTIYEDNQSTIHLAHNPINHQRTKHIDICYHYTREKINSKEIEIKHIAGVNQPADMLTKAATRESFEGNGRKLGLWN